MSFKLEQLFQEMYELTAPECASVCRAPHSCCSPEYCDMAEERAEEFGVEILRTDHPTLKFMGSSGCVVPPYLRPLCTLHTCAINSFGFKPGDPKWSAKYFKLRDKITLEENEKVDSINRFSRLANMKVNK